MQVKTFFLSLIITLNIFAVESDPHQLSNFSNSQLDTFDIPISNYTNTGSDDLAFAIDIRGNSSGTYYTFKHQVNSFADITAISENPPSNLRPHGLEWNQEMTKMYGVSKAIPQSLIRVSSISGGATAIADFTGDLEDVTLQGIAIDKNNRCFVIATDDINHQTKSTLYECNLTNGELTFIGSQTLAADIHDITASCDGMLYGVDYSRRSLFSINKHNGEASFIGRLNVSFDDRINSITYDRKAGKIYGYVNYGAGYFSRLIRINKTTGVGFNTAGDVNGNLIGASKSTCANFNSLDINPGYNGAWYYPETNGQGFLFDIYPQSNTFFATWFTFDLTSSETEGSSDFGSSQQRWFAAQGELGEGDSVELTIYSNSQGLFDDTTPVQTDAVGTMTVTFQDCSNGVVEYAFNEGDINGVIPIQRLANDNVELCNALSESTQ